MGWRTLHSSRPPLVARGPDTIPETCPPGEGYSLFSVASCVSKASS
jgi:hypothetical protein